LRSGPHVDVLVARVVPTRDGRPVEFDALWERRRAVVLAPDVAVQMPTIADLILTKRIAERPKDLEDIRLLEILQHEDER
jgi:hypothetical protein